MPETTTPPATGQRAYAYTRVSTGRQELSGLSEEAQARAAQEYYARVLEPKGVEWGELLFEAVSAFTRPLGKRRMGALLLALLKRDDHLIIPKVDRAFRNLLDFVVTVDELEKRGVVIHLCDFGLDMSTHFGKAMGKFFCCMAATFAEMESQAVGNRVRAACAVNKSRGRVLTGLPKGWKFVHPNRNEIVPDEEERALIREMHAMRARGMSTAEIAKDLNRRGIKRPVRLPKRRIKYDTWPATIVANWIVDTRERLKEWDGLAIAKAVLEATTPPTPPEQP